MNAHDKFLLASRMAWRKEKMDSHEVLTRMIPQDLLDRIAELEAENKRLLDQLERTQGYYAENQAEYDRIQGLYQAAIEQRDSLIEALQNIAANPSGLFIEEHARQALASLDQSSSPHTEQTPAEHEDND